MGAISVSLINPNLSSSFSGPDPIIFRLKLDSLVNKDNQKIKEMIKETLELEHETTSLDNWVSEI